MSSLNLLLMFTCVLGISIGQILFKLGALAMRHHTGPTWQIFFNAYLISAVILYAAATLLWVWVLREVPLTISYPVMASAFVIVPILSSIFVGEPFHPKILIGGAVITLGILISVK